MPKKLKLKDLNVNSFVTRLECSEEKKVKCGDGCLCYKCTLCPNKCVTYQTCTCFTCETCDVCTVDGPCLTQLIINTVCNVY
jgi:hypothetical protein